MQDMQGRSDEQLVKCVCTGEIDHYAVLIRRYQQKLLRYATNLTGDEQLAADAVQEAFIRAFANLKSFNQKLTFSSWIYRIVHNQAINLIHKNTQHTLIDEAVAIDSGVNLEDALIHQELLVHLHRCIEQMPLIYKAPLTLYFLEEKKYEEISDILRIPMGTVAIRIRRAKAIVKTLCQKSK